MPGELGADTESVRVLSAAEVSEQQRREAVWESLYSIAALQRQEGAWDPRIWEQLQDHDPTARVFAVENSTNRTHLLPHLGATGTKQVLFS